jgi:hypothetical protein
MARRGGGPVGRYLAPAFLGGLGAVFLVAGSWILLNGSANRELARGAALAPVTASTLRLRNPGEVVLLEGRLAAGNRAGFREFVAYRRDRYAGSETSGASQGRERWTPIETVAPPLEVDAEGGTVAIVNHGYDLQGDPHRWRDVPALTDLLGHQGERASGFFAGDVVTLEGRVVDGPQGAGADRARALEARVLFGGDRAAYLAHLRGGVLATRILGGVFLGVGAALTLLAAWLGRRASLARPARVTSR